MTAPDPDRIRQVLQEQAEQIGRHVWSVTAVGAGEDTPQFAYTVGLTQLDRPELFIAGLPVEVMHGLLNDLAGRTVDRGERYHHGQVIGDLLHGYDVTMVDGPALLSMPLSMATRRYGRARVRVQQVVWPDRKGRFPWDTGWSLPDGAQPTIGRPS